MSDPAQATRYLPGVELPYNLMAEPAHPESLREPQSRDSLHSFALGNESASCARPDAVAAVKDASILIFVVPASWKAEGARGSLKVGWKPQSLEVSQGC